MYSTNGIGRSMRNRSEKNDQECQHLGSVQVKITKNITYKKMLLYKFS
jgi:hypothetical protein